MTKTLTQEDFKCAPDWVRSAAVDEDGYAWGYAVDTLFLQNDETKALIAEIESQNYDVENPTSKNTAINALSGNQSNV